MLSFWEPGRMGVIGVGLGVVGFALSGIYAMLGFAYYFEFVLFPVWVLLFGVLLPAMGFMIADMKYTVVGAVMLVGSGVMVLVLLLRMAIFVMYALVGLLNWWYYGVAIWSVILVLLSVLASGVGAFFCMMCGISISEGRTKTPQDKAT